MSIQPYQNGAYHSSDYWQKPELERLVDFILIRNCWPSAMLGA